MTAPEIRHDQPAAASADGLQRMLDAHRLLTADLSSAAMIERLLLAAVALADADYGAVAVLSPTGAVDQTTVHHAELAERENWRAALGTGAGGARGPADARARQFGEGRLAGATVRARGAAYVEIYVGTVRADGFAAEALRLLQSLAEFAGTAFENALLHEDAQRSKDWLQASGEIARSLLSNADDDMLLQVVLRALHVAEADSVGLFLPEGNSRLRVAVTAGRGAQDFRGAVIDGDASALGRAILRGESMLVDDMAEVMRQGYANVHEYGPVMAAPLVDARGVRGSVVLCRRRGRLGFTARDLDLATTFADQLSVALEMDDARLRSEWVTVLEDRHRIAQDLHDNVMQRLFATGVGLQSLAGGPLPPEVGQRLARYIAELDETIDEIRTRVFGLRDVHGLPQAPVTSRFPRVTPGELAPGQRAAEDG